MAGPAWTALMTTRVSVRWDSVARSVKWMLMTVDYRHVIGVVTARMDLILLRVSAFQVLLVCRVVSFCLEIAVERVDYSVK